MNDSAGPYLKAALFCEKVLQEKDGVFSAIRIVDRFTITAEGPDAPVDMPPFTVNLTMLLSFTSGAAQGRHTLKIQPEGPSGLRLPELSVDALFEGADRGPQIVMPMAFQVREEGLYWFDVFLDGQLMTRMPLRIIYRRVTAATGKAQ